MTHAWRHRIILVLVGSITLAPFAMFTYSMGRADQNEATIRRICESSNDQGRKQKTLWEGIILLSAGSPSTQTPEQRAAGIKQLRELLDDVYAPQDC